MSDNLFTIAMSLLGKVLLKKREPVIQISKKEFAKFLVNNPIVVEAGAHNGKDTVELSDHWPNGMIHAFEPIPELFGELSKNTRNARNVVCYQKALGARSGIQQIHVSGGASDGSSSLLKPELHTKFHPAVTFDKVIPVEAVTLDDWMEKEQVPSIDMLWLDLQGAEPAVLRASPRALRSVQLIHTEVSLVQAYEGAELYRDFRTWLEAQGFRVVKELLPHPDMGNVFFLRTR